VALLSRPQGQVLRAGGVSRQQGGLPRCITSYKTGPHHTRAATGACGLSPSALCLWSPRPKMFVRPGFKRLYVGNLNFRTTQFTAHSTSS
jgi:hypothetical protein